MKSNKLLIFIFILLAFSQIAYAHPPRDIQMDYDVKSGKLHVTLKHPTNNVRDHYIRKIVIYKNDEEIGSHVFSSQTTAAGFDEEFAVKADPKDIISIKAFCNKAGTGESSIEVK